ncbi:2-keto-4-pentenoate hydratase/2-oxohepta-3-ene-1,7-dioic acid hydratase in catechol pathway [Salana multivorans]|uniref:2-keto-4-pentenoate hydratase/2-oxohepta-3-ene-1,7-dioic acid hydratase in catechol pathway n=1 Tax=Salana multivorans TaxID=120377 RepID=A0A3N2D0T6_9MICO|nr:fumarylacetoacetate hydrolase family protein [Salana multivorans]ROR93084.1 2-keto-4-pentenoate hydratase/2-oxohepta-3-ene-1,7-dioic acid hydratase in catechol pathway [Salana multivorans]
MRIARVAVGDDPRYAVVQGEGNDPEQWQFAMLAGDPLYGGVEPTGQVLPADGVRLLAPVIPRSKVVGVGRNYAEHAAELGNEVPERPLVFLKPNTSVIGPDDPIVLPSYSDDVHFEGELAVVVSRLCKDVPVARALDVVLGYTVANDVTARDQGATGPWALKKGFDSSCPLGPVIATDVDPGDLRIRTWVDGELRQDGSTAQMLVGVSELIAYVSSIFTLLPGDVILTGTPAGVGRIDAGQRVEVEIEGIGRLGNPVLRR